MPIFEKHAPGTFSWVELSTSDQKGGNAFYSSLFGWEGKDNPAGPDAVYTTFLREGRTVAASCTLSKMEKDNGVPPHWNVYICVENADATAARAAELGGHVIAPPFDVMNYGRMAVIGDPTGAFFCIWQPKTHIGVSVRDEPGSMVWCDLNTSDVPKAEAFYTGLFGWKPLVGAGVEGYKHLQLGDREVGGMGPLHNPAMPPHWMVYFLAADCDASTAKAKELGANVLMEPFSMEKVGRIAVIADPQGSVFSLFQPAAH